MASPSATRTRTGTFLALTDRAAALDRCGRDDDEDAHMPMIEIWDESPVEFGDLLAATQGADELRWSVLEFWGVARDVAIDVVAIEREAAASPTGLLLSANELREFAAELAQVIDGIVVGYREDPPNRSDVDLRASCEIVIEAIDSTLWRIYARDEAVVEALRRKYVDVRTVEPEVVLRPLHDET